MAAGDDLARVDKKVFSLPRFTTASGATLRDLRIGWESYGTLNQDRSNAILITHYFSATSHAAGRYEPGEAIPGWWDAIIGPGKAIDTDRYFVLASDTLTNMNGRDPRVVTTGPSSLDPATGRPYGLSFPVVTIGDFVAVQKALVESLGITRLHAVAGPSMGALQAYEWAASYPEMVGRIVPAIGAAGGSPYLIAWLDAWAQPIRLDPAWRGGGYYGSTFPEAGMSAALKLVTLHAQQAEWAEREFGRDFAAPAGDPALALAHEYKIVDVLDIFAAGRATAADANNFLYLVRANQLAATDATRIRCPTLLLHAPGDLVFPPDWIDRTAAQIRSSGAPVETLALEGPNGHLNGILRIAQAGDRIAAFLDG